MPRSATATTRRPSSGGSGGRAASSTGTSPSWALHQSWRADPVSTQQWLVEQLQSELYLRDQASNNSSSSFQAPITYYYVIGNLEAANSATLLRRTSGNLYRGHRQQKQQAGFVRSNLYVVFIVNQRWVTGTTGPFVNYAMRGLLDDS